MNTSTGCGRRMPRVEGVEGALSLRPRGRIGRECFYGRARRGYSKYGESNVFAGVYQRRVTGYNQYGRNPDRPRREYYIRMRNPLGRNPRTEPQQANRGKFADACAAWNSLTVVEKAVYNQRGKRKNRIGRNLFISEYMRRAEAE